MRYRLTIIGAVIGLAAANAPAAELVTNGGFETGNFSGWTMVEPGGFSVVGSNPAFAHSGNHYAALAPAVGAVGTLSQTLATTAGESYTLSFWLANNSSIPVNSFSAKFDGANVVTLTSPPFPSTGAYQPFSFNVVATGSSSLLEFNYRHDDDFWRLDDISVQATAAVPEPASWAMLLAGFALLGAAVRRRTRLGRLPAVSQPGGS